MNDFLWCKYDCADLIPENWYDPDYIMELAIYKELIPSDFTSREASDVKSVPTYVVDGIKIRENFPWIFELYEGVFLDFAKKCIDEKVYVAKNDIYAVNLNIQKGTYMRYECHIDSNPLQGVFNLTEHGITGGGELVVSNNKDAIGVKQIEENCIVEVPILGRLHLFDLDKHPHYVRPLLEENDIRVTATMNYYTDNSPELSRPTTLTNHLF